MALNGDIQNGEFPTLHALNGLEQRELLNVVDKLRAQGLSAFTALPQLIVCGDQSSGKSSVLAALSELPFPRKDNLCTRFATEVILRRSDELSIAVSIGPGIGRSAEARHKDFARLVTSKDEFPAIFESAQAAMGLTESGKAFSDNILRIEIRGPTYPQLTIVDLPGLIHTETKTQTAEDVELVSRLISDYMVNPKSIILAVVSAKNDIANQIVLQKARKIDRGGLRTLGVITKPDQLYPGSRNEESFLELARNEEVKFKLGWHVVKNQDLGSGNCNLDNRDKEEADYFRDSNFRHLPSTELGIVALRKRLSKVLFDQVRKELPDLVRDIEDKLSICQIDLEKLGTPLYTTQERRTFLLRLSQQFQVLCNRAIEGSYRHDFFGEGLDRAALEKRLRARVRNLDMEFSQSIQNNGAKWKIVPSQKENNLASRRSPKKLTWTRSQAVDHVLEVLRANRGQELPGLPSPRLVGTVFREYSSPWEEIAQDYVMKVWSVTKRFLEQVFGHLTNPQISKSLLELWVNPKMEKALSEAKELLKSLLQVHEREPMTTNHYFTETAHALRLERMRPSIESKLRDLLVPGNKVTQEDIARVIDVVKFSAEPDMDRYAAEAALDNMQAFYKTAMKLFIDNVPNLVTEVAIVAPLPNLFEPTEVLDMTEKDLSAITAETKENKARRDELNAKLKVLQDGARTCKEYATYQTMINDAREGAADGEFDEGSHAPSGKYREDSEDNDDRPLVPAYEQSPPQSVTSGRGFEKERNETRESFSPGVSFTKKKVTTKKGRREAESEVYEPSPRALDPEWTPERLQAVIEKWPSPPQPPQEAEYPMVMEAMPEVEEISWEAPVAREEIPKKKKKGRRIFSSEVSEF